MRQRLVMFAWAIAALPMLAACVITIVPDQGSPQVDRPRPDPAAVVIERFESNRSSYRVGDTLSFRIRTNRPGYVTLTAYDPDGSVYVFARNVQVRGNRTETIPAPFGRTRFTVTSPVGLHVVRAHFTPERTPESVVFRGVGSLDAWLAQIVLEIRGFGFGAESVAETRFEVRR